MAKKYDKEALVNDWRTGGYTQHDLASKYSVSRSLVAKIVKDIPKDLEQLIAKEVEVKQELALKSDKEVTAIDTEVKHRLGLIKDIEKFSSRAIRKANQLLDVIESGQDLKHIADAVDKISVTNKINDRHPKPTQINNNQQNNYSSLADDDLVRELKRVREQNAIIDSSAK